MFQIIGIVLSGVAVGLLGYLWMNKYVYLELPETITNEELKKAQIKRLEFVSIEVTLLYDFVCWSHLLPTLKELHAFP